MRRRWSGGDWIGWLPRAEKPSVGHELNLARARTGIKGHGGRRGREFAKSNTPLNHAVPTSTQSKTRMRVPGMQTDCS